MRRIKVLQVVTGLGPGGAERLLLNLMNHFDKTQFDVRLVSIVNDLRALEAYQCPETLVEVFHMKKLFPVIELLRFRLFIRKFAPDILHLHMYHSLIATFLATRLMNLNASICFTSHRYAYSGVRRVVTRLLRDWRSADIIFTASQCSTDNAIRQEVIGNGVHVGLHCPLRKPWTQGGPIRLLVVGRIVDEKDPLGLLKSISKVNIPGLTLDFLGSGPLENEAKDLTHKLGIANQVRFRGFCSDIREQMRRADLLLIHSKTEGMPMALLEAGAEAMPVISTPVGAVPDILGSDRGWLATHVNFADVVRAVVKDPTQALAAGCRLRAHVLNNYDIQTTVRAHEELYSSLVG